MKKFAVIVIFLCFSCLSALAVDVIPTSSKSIKNYGVGILKIDKPFDVYAEPSETSKKLGHFSLQNTKPPPEGNGFLYMIFSIILFSRIDECAVDASDSIFEIAFADTNDDVKFA